MPFIKLQFQPGLNRDQTNYSGEGGWWECDKVRFRSGYPEKIGGWLKSTTETFLGTARQLWNWVTTYNDNFLALGTEKKLYIEVGGYFHNITPFRAEFTSTDTDNCITITNGSSVVVFDLAVAHDANTGNYVEISGVAGSGSPAALGGIPVSEINGNHEVTVINANAFSIVVATTATATNTSVGGTAINVSFEIEPGNAYSTYGYGWGTSTWGSTGWGLGSDMPVNLPQRDWWLDNFDNDLVANIRNGAIYYWERGSTADPTTALETRAVLLSSLSGANSVPDEAMQVLISQNDKHLLAFGCTPYGGGTFDPLLIRWASQDEPQYWNPTGLTPGGVQSSSGFLRVSRGSRIVRALSSRQETLVWTDSSLYALQYLGTLDVFGLQEYADNVSIIGPRACASANNVTYWMGHDKFYAYSGRVETLPCTIRNYVFQDINYNAVDTITCGTNEGWNEVWWMYPSADSEYPNRYVIFNHLEKVWYYGTIDRSGWLDSPLREYPMAVNTPYGTDIGVLYDHERGVNDDAVAMTSYIQSADMDIADGEQFMLSRRMIPDINFNGSTASDPEVTVELRPRNFPGSGYQSDANDARRVIQTAVNQFTDQVFIRARSRQMAFKVLSDTLDVQWQLGSPRIDVRTDGKR